MRMVAVLGNIVWHIMNGEHAIEESNENEKQQAESEVVEKCVEIDIARGKKVQAN